MHELQLNEFITAHTLPRYRTRQFNKAVYQDYITCFDELSTWSKDLRELLKQEVVFSTLTCIKEHTSKDAKTIKIVFERTSDAKRFETVLMKHDDGRNTVCVSSMIGCPVRCLFCATGSMGFIGNLTASEIVDQVLYIARLLKKENQTVTNIVFMGMGEPLLNLAAVEDAIAIFTSSEKMGMSDRRITISTSGITNKLQELFQHGYKGRLALSLHAPNQALREQIMPVAKKYPLPELLGEISSYAKRTNKRVSYEYILIDGINDTVSCARQLVRIMDPKLSHVNLIPYNPVAGVSYTRSSNVSISAFAAVLEKYHIQHTIRVTMGDDIAAACGQLAGKI